VLRVCFGFCAVLARCAALVLWTLRCACALPWQAVMFLLRRVGLLSNRTVAAGNGAEMEEPAAAAAAALAAGVNNEASAAVPTPVLPPTTPFWLLSAVALATIVHVALGAVLGASALFLPCFFSPIKKTTLPLTTPEHHQPPAGGQGPQKGLGFRVSGARVDAQRDADRAATAATDTSLRRTWLLLFGLEAAILSPSLLAFARTTMYNGWSFAHGYDVLLVLPVALACVRLAHAGGLGLGRGGAWLGREEDAGSSGFRVSTLVLVLGVAARALLCAAAMGVDTAAYYTLAVVAALLA
jgi:hypothetical protein